MASSIPAHLSYLFESIELNSFDEKLLFGLIHLTYLGFDSLRVLISSLSYSTNYLEMVYVYMDFLFAVPNFAPSAGLTGAPDLLAGGYARLGGPPLEPPPLPPPPDGPAMAPNGALVNRVLMTLRLLPFIILSICSFTVSLFFSMKFSV